LILSQNMWFQDSRMLLPTPLFGWAAQLPGGFNEVLYWMLMALNAALVMAPEYRVIGLATLPIYVFFVLQDEVRWQFYLYMQFFNLLAAGALPRKGSQ